MGTIVVDAGDWDALLDAIQSIPALRALNAYPRRTRQGVLAAPIAVARWLGDSGPHLKERSTFKLLVIGAEKFDAVDRGGWYQVIGALLGQSLVTRVTLLGDRLNQQFVSPARAVAPGPEARCYCGTLASFVASEDLAGFDLAFMFHPGFQKHRGWLTDGSLAKLVAARVPVVVSSYEHDESQIDQWVAECHGFSIPPFTLSNPFYVDLSDPGSTVRWGRALWQLGERAPAKGEPDHTRLAALDELASMVMHSISIGRKPQAAYGASITARASTGAVRGLIYVFDEFFLDPQTREVLALTSGELSVVKVIDVAEVAAYPGESSSALARAVWAAGIKSTHLLDRCPRPIDQASREALGRAMHASLEDKVDAFFRAA
jgi:hypothetical protein